MCQMDEGSEQIAAQCAYWLEGVLLVNWIFLLSRKISEMNLVE